jgi:DmsE family decaheme c-type cytochrome
VKPWVRTAGTVLAALVAACAFGGAVLSGDVTPRALASTPNAAGTPQDWSGDDACIECHAEQRTALRGSVHGAALGMATGDRALRCEACHGPGAAHAQDPSSASMADLRAASSATVNGTCTVCHALPLEEGVLHHQHESQGLRCTDCHRVHGSTHPALLRAEPTPVCLSCHENVAPELRQVSHHPVHEGRMRCTSCHLPDASVVAAAAPAGATGTCVACHAEHDPLAPFEHPVANDATLTGEGCTGCHAPHGSAHRRLLLRPGNALCLDCHNVPRHATAHGGAFAGQRCQDCHVDVHGSFTSRRFFRPELLGQDCLVCHER